MVEDKNRLNGMLVRSALLLAAVMIVPACKGGDDGAPGAAGSTPPQSQYVVSSTLNNMSHNLTTTNSLLSNYAVFDKGDAGTAVEVVMNSRVLGGTFVGGATGARFQLRIDGVAASIENQGAITTTGSTEFLSIKAVFLGLSAGIHTVSVWGRVNAGTSTGALLDPGGWDGRIIVKETW